MARKKTSPFVIILACCFVIAALAGAYGWFYNVRFVQRIKTRHYAKAIENPNASRGGFSAKIQQEIDPDIATPFAVRLLYSDDYLSRKEGLNIIRHFHAHEVADEVAQILLKENDEFNKVLGLSLLGELRQNTPSFVPRIVPFLDDPSPTVREIACTMMMNISGEYNPGRDAEWWKAWWEERKAQYVDAPVAAPPS